MHERDRRVYDFSILATYFAHFLSFYLVDPQKANSLVRISA